MAMPTDADVRLRAAVELIGRTGATSFEVGYEDDDVPVGQAPNWYATAEFHGGPVRTDLHVWPHQAAEALARRLLDGGTCTHCGDIVNVGDGAAFIGVCRWARRGDRWERGCLDCIPEGARPIQTDQPNRPNRAARRRAR